MTVKEILTLVTDQLQEHGPDVVRKIKQWIYDASIDMRRVHNFKCITFITKFNGTGDQNYPLPSIFQKVHNHEPVVIDDVPIGNINSNIYNTRTWDLRDYITWNSKVKIVSTTNEDGSAKKVVPFDGLADTREIIALNGVTPVLSSEDFNRLSYIHKDQTVGKVTVTDEADELSLELGPGAGSYTAKSIYFSEDIGTSENISITFIKQLRRLTDDYDLDELTANYGDIIVLYCLYRGFFHQEDEPKAKELYALYGTELVKAIKEDRKNKKISNYFTFIPRQQ